MHLININNNSQNFVDFAIANAKNIRSIELTDTLLIVSILKIKKLVKIELDETLIDLHNLQDILINNNIT